MKTHTACPTACRGPGMVNGVAMIEVMLEHAAAELGMSPLDLRMKNMLESGDAIMPPPDTFGNIFKIVLSFANAYFIIIINR